MTLPTLRRSRFRLLAAALSLAVLGGAAARADAGPVGQDAYEQAYETFMNGDLAGARSAFARVRDLPGADRAYAADAAVRVGWLYEVAQRLAEAEQVFARVRANTNAPSIYRAEAAIGIGQCRFDAGDMAAASNACMEALAVLDAGPVAAGDASYAHWLKLFAESHRDLAGLSEDDPYYNNRMRQRAAKWPSPIEQAARESVLRRWMAQQGLSPERCWLKGRWAFGTASPAAPYPAAGFPYAWEFDGASLDGLSLTQGLERVRAEAGCLTFTTGTNAGFGWGRSARSDPHPALRVGYATNLHETCPALGQLRVRLKQSLPMSAWRVRVGGLPRRKLSGYEGWDSESVPVRGTNWQEVVFKVSAGPPPYLGVQVFSDTPGNDVAVDWVRPEVCPGTVCVRRDLVLPTAARWVKVSVSAAGRFRLFVNGREAVYSPPKTDYRQIWNYALDPAGFGPGTNVVALELEGLPQVLLDGAVLCVDGTYLRFDSNDQSWRTGIPPAGRDWTLPGSAEAAAWPAARVVAEPPDPLARFWFNPSYKGGILIEPADGRPQPVFGCREPVAFRVAVPARANERPEVTWRLFDTMGRDGAPADRQVASGALPVQASGGLAGAELRFAPGALASNAAYALEVDWRQAGAPVETRRYELAVCGPVPLPEIANPTTYTDGMELKQVWEMDAASEPPADAFVSCDGNALPRPSTVVQTPLGRFRQPYTGRQLGSLGGSPCNYISYRYRIEHPGRPHVAIAAYPDDTVRCQEMRITEDGGERRPGILSGNVLGNDTVVLGFDNPLTHELREQHCLFFPGRHMGTISFLSLAMPGWDATTAARVGRIRIYEVLDGPPARRMADAPGPRKWVGQFTERGPSQILASCLGNPLRDLYRLTESPVFYRNWLETSVNMVKRMKFAGENAHFMGQYMYDRVLYPSAFSDTVAVSGNESGSLRDYGVLLARMFDENGLGLFSVLQLVSSDRIPLTADDEAVAAGAPTFAQVDREGRQVLALGEMLAPNWTHPAVRRWYEQVVGEVADLYAKEPGWKGLVLHQHDSVGPAWYAPHRDPGGASYDDVTLARFEADTGLRVPVSAADPGRFAKRHAWLKAEAWPRWIDWRCAQIHEIYRWTARHLKARRPDLDLIVYPYASYLTPPYDEAPEDRLPTLFDYGRRGGMDLERIKRDPDMILAANIFVSVEVGGVDTISGDFESWMRGKHDQVGRGRALAHRDSSLAPLANDGKNGLAVRYNWYEAQPRGPDYWLWTFSSPESWPYPQDDYFADYWINGFVRTHPRLILHPLMDAILWNGREVSMSRFAQAFRSLPAAVYTRLTGRGRDRNVRMAAGPFEGRPYAYVANPWCWDTDVTLTLAPGVQGRELTTDEPVAGSVWKGRLPAYTMRTFRFEGQPAEPIVACETAVGALGRREIERRLAAWRQALDAHRASLERIGRAADFEAVVREAESAWGAGDGGTAYERLSGFPARRVWSLVEARRESPFFSQGWMISRLLPRDGRRDVRAVAPVRPDDATLEWQPLNVSDNRVLARGRHGELDGFVYFANRIRAPVGGEWTLCVGHDGGCRVWIDGQEALCQPALRNPIREDRTKAAVTLAEGDHELLVGFDMHEGLGYGFTLRFRPPGDAPRRTFEFPAPAPRAAGE